MPDRLSALATRLRELGDRATPGPWVSDGTEIIATEPDGRTYRYNDGDKVWIGETCALSDQDDANAALIAAFNPQVATALANLIDGIAADHHHATYRSGDSTAPPLSGCSHMDHAPWPCPERARLDGLADLFGVPSAGEETGD